MGQVDHGSPFSLLLKQWLFLTSDIPAVQQGDPHQKEIVISV